MKPRTIDNLVGAQLRWPTRAFVAAAVAAAVLVAALAPVVLPIGMAMRAMAGMRMPG